MVSSISQFVSKHSYRIQVVIISRDLIAAKNFSMIFVVHSPLQVLKVIESFCLPHKDNKIN